ncbi:MAG: hypothetical protein JST61_05685 [Acidobacteria bacterium]|nr:hypothetical protein [Acidobacteriota bacterium]
MFERYTEKARRVVFFARYEASEFGSSTIESEFLLLGLLRESKDVVYRWLGEGDWQTILREEVEKRVYKEKRISTSVDLPLSDDAKRVLAYAAEEAERLGHSMIGTEHLFLGLLHDPGSRCGKMLVERGVDIRAVRSTLAQEGASERTGGEPRAGAGAITRRSVPIFIVMEKSGEILQPYWQLQIPAVGDRVTVRRNKDDGTEYAGEDDATVYEVVHIEWEVTETPPELPFLSKVLVHVRNLVV